MRSLELLPLAKKTCLMNEGMSNGSLCNLFFKGISKYVSLLEENSLNTYLSLKCHCNFMERFGIAHLKTF